MKDALGNEVNLYDVVGYAYNSYGQGVRMRYGIVIRFTPKSMEIAYKTVDKASGDPVYNSDVVIAHRVIKTQAPDPLNNPKEYDRLATVAKVLHQQGHEGIMP